MGNPVAPQESAQGCFGGFCAELSALMQKKGKPFRVIAPEIPVLSVKDFKGPARVLLKVLDELAIFVERWATFLDPFGDKSGRPAEGKFPLRRRKARCSWGREIDDIWT